MVQLGDHDFLDLSDLHGPLLDDVMKSSEMYNQMRAVAELIKAGYLARVPRDTSALAGTARVTMHRSTLHRDRRWEAEFSVGNAAVDYAAEVEARDHPLGETLRALGFGDVDLGAQSPTPAPRPEPTRSSSDVERPDPRASFGTDEGYNRVAAVVDRIQSPGRRPGSKAMERDVQELRDMLAELPDDDGGASLGRAALSSYEVLKAAREERGRY